MELVCVVISVVMVILYNLQAVMVTQRVNEADITKMIDFYNDSQVMRTWTVYLATNMTIQILLCSIFSAMAFQLVRTLRKFFRQQFSMQTRALLFATIAILIASFLSLLNDVIYIYVELGGHYADNQFDDVAVPSLIIWFPCLTINLLHLKNICMQKKAIKDANRHAGSALSARRDTRDSLAAFAERNLRLASVDEKFVIEEQQLPSSAYNRWTAMMGDPQTTSGKSTSLSRLQSFVNSTD